MQDNTIRKIALMTLLNREESSLSPHFGKAKWILVRDIAQGSSRFLQNTGLNGKSVVEQLIREGCTDVIASEIGAGAAGHLERAQVRGWLGPAGIPAPRLLEMLMAGALPRIAAPAGEGGCCHHARAESHSGGGCCCG